MHTTRALSALGRRAGGGLVCRKVYLCLFDSQIYEALQQGQRLPQPQGCPDNIYEMMLMCWAFAPDDRPDFLKLAMFTQRRSEDYYS